MKLTTMTNEQIIKQLEKLIDDREAFCISDPEHDESYIKDIDALKAAIDIIRNCGAREVRKVGRWINDGCIDMYCSECGNTPDHEPGMTPEATDYCPYCGARMDGDAK